MITPRQCRAARVGIEVSRKELSARAGIGERTLIDFERGARQPIANNIKAIRQALESYGVRFTEDGCICLPPEPTAD